jgi:hypothetical protein
VRFSTSLSQHSAELVVNRIAHLIVGGEDIRFVGTCMTFRPLVRHFVVTSARIIGLGSSVAFAYVLRELFECRVVTETTSIALRLSDGARVELRRIPTADLEVLRNEISRAFNEEVDREVLRSIATSASELAREMAAGSGLTGAIGWAGQTTGRVIEDAVLLPPSGPRRDEQVLGSGNPPPSHGSNPAASATEWRGARVTQKALEAIRLECGPGENPWLVLNPAGFTGLLAAFEDRLVIIKAGAMTSALAGSFLGKRVASFHYKDITGIEFNAGMVNGVLEILTPSYDGSANRDFWVGTTRRRNANSNDPFTLSNTLPMLKSEYKQFHPDIVQLRSRISSAKSPVSNIIIENTPSVVHPVLGIADELARLAELRASGTLSPEEFDQLKARLLNL